MPAPHRAHSSRLRSGRHSASGQIYLLTTVTDQRQPFFTDFHAARLLIAEMRTVCADGLGQSLAWVVMPDHLHWLLSLQQGSLAQLMKRLKARSAQGINRHLHRNGPLWQDGYHDRAARTDDDLQAMARYIVANPLRAGLVTRLADYPHWDAIWLP